MWFASTIILSLSFKKLSINLVEPNLLLELELTWDSYRSSTRITYHGHGWMAEMALCIVMHKATSPIPLQVVTRIFPGDVRGQW